MKLQYSLMCTVAAIACLAGCVLPEQVTQEQGGQKSNGQVATSQPDSKIQPGTLQDAAPPANAPAIAPAPVHLSAAAKAEAERNCPKPAFPAESSRAGHKGSVVVGFWIGGDGAVGGTRIAKSSGYPLLDAAGVAAISACRFKRVDENYEPAPAWLNVTYHFM